MENKDIWLRTDDSSFHLRAAALVIENGRLLVAKEKHHNPFYTIGGGVRVGETTREAAQREAWEETGIQYEVDRLLYIQERFFTYGGMQKHEVAFYYLMKETHSEIAEGTQSDYAGETLHWIPVEELPATEIVPDFLKTALQNMPENVRHFVTREDDIKA